MHGLAPVQQRLQDSTHAADTLATGTKWTTPSCSCNLSTYLPVDLEAILVQKSKGIIPAYKRVCQQQAGGALRWRAGPLLTHTRLWPASEPADPQVLSLKHPHWGPAKPLQPGERATWSRMQQ